MSGVDLLGNFISQVSTLMLGERGDANSYSETSW